MPLQKYLIIITVPVLSFCSFTISFAQNLDNNPSTQCAGNSINCALETSVNSQALGLSGPFTASLRYDNYLTWILDAGYSQAFYDAAAAFKFSIGPNERRANTTFGYALTPQQQVKFTYEFLSQNLPFDFSSGKVNQWASQNAFGAAYRYVWDNNFLRSLEIYGSYSNANSKELSTVNDPDYTYYRRIAGGVEKVGGTAVTLSPTQNTLIKLGGGYSTLNFDTKWEKAQTDWALAYNAEISQILTSTTLLNVGIDNTVSGRTYTAKVKQILPGRLEGSLSSQHTTGMQGVKSGSSISVALSYPAAKTYQNTFTADFIKVKQWVESPIIYYNRVLAKTEEKKVAKEANNNNEPTGGDAPSWNSGMMLPTLLNPIRHFPTVEMTPYVKSNLKSQEPEKFNFALVGNNPNWVKISDDKQFLISNDQPNDTPRVPYTTTITLVATSQSTGEQTPPISYKVQTIGQYMTITNNMYPTSGSLAGKEVVLKIYAANDENNTPQQYALNPGESKKIYFWYDGTPFGATASFWVSVDGVDVRTTQVPSLKKYYNGANQAFPCTVDAKLIINTTDPTGEYKQVVDCK